MTIRLALTLKKEPISHLLCIYDLDPDYVLLLRTLIF